MICFHRLVLLSWSYLGQPRRGIVGVYIDRCITGVLQKVSLIHFCLDFLNGLRYIFLMIEDTLARNRILILDSYEKIVLVVLENFNGCVHGSISS